MMDISIILVSNKPKELARVIDQFNRQSFDGFTVELVVVQCLNETNRFQFVSITYPQMAKIRQMVAPYNNYYDNAAAARDFGFKESCGNYIIFWDDDNLYFPHYLTTLFSAVYGRDMAVARVYHSEYVIGDQITPGRIDTMCVCVRRAIAEETQWYDGGGGYNDYRWLRRCSEKQDIDINFVPTIVGKHL
jgi:glycosyltransferase involved in cell wall biosynthesis